MASWASCRDTEDTFLDTEDTFFDIEPLSETEDELVSAEESTVKVLKNVAVEINFLSYLY